MAEIRLSLEDAHELACQVLETHGTPRGNARCVSRALVAAERDGQRGHGLSRLPSYAAQSASGKVNGRAEPAIVNTAPAGIRIDAAHGFAFPACAVAVDELARLAPHTKIGAAGIFRSHHFGQAGYHVEMLAQRGLLALALSNSPKAIAPWGGRSPVFGTNPLAFAAPRVGQPPLVVDLSLSKMARGKVMAAAENGEPLPRGVALDADGRPTTDAQAALTGTMLPMGDAKGAALVLIVEILSAVLTGAKCGYEATSFFTADGEPPGVGHFLMAIDGSFFSGETFAAHLDGLVVTILAQSGTRLPGSRRLEARRRAAREGLHIPAALHEKLVTLAGRV